MQLMPRCALQLKAGTNLLAVTGNLHLEFDCNNELPPSQKHGRLPPNAVVPNLGIHHLSKRTSAGPHLPQHHLSPIAGFGRVTMSKHGKNHNCSLFGSKCPLPALAAYKDAVQVQHNLCGLIVGRKLGQADTIAFMRQAPHLIASNLQSAAAYSRLLLYLERFWRMRCP
eukprot:gnl/MRDRNA2_/MRDRNA2_77696_c0_seq1.p2 gnl/MRDRNA2_/MRDRNA2_77696_c0~~gnl/MRDRNA2_/MRDRNA2_77696_c0_seq1.p2  ORF type:complete len:169 (-),score=24.73 gnl/MRDRNA2_/MRDRNA2_77696_c0_seq1:371-877(-)